MLPEDNLHHILNTIVHRKVDAGRTFAATGSSPAAAGRAPAKGEIRQTPRAGCVAEHKCARPSPLPERGALAGWRLDEPEARC